MISIDESSDPSSFVGTESALITVLSSLHTFFCSVRIITNCLKKLTHFERNQSKPLVEVAGGFFATNITTRSIHDTK